MSLFTMLILILVVMWLSGYAGWPYAGYRGNNLLHIILVIALLVFLFGRRGVL